MLKVFTVLAVLALAQIALAEQISLEELKKSVEPANQASEEHLAKFVEMFNSQDAKEAETRRQNVQRAKEESLKHIRHFQEQLNKFHDSLEAIKSNRKSPEQDDSASKQIEQENSVQEQPAAEPAEEKEGFASHLSLINMEAFKQAKRDMLRSVVVEDAKEKVGLLDRMARFAQDKPEAAERQGDETLNKKQEVKAQIERVKAEMKKFHEILARAGKANQEQLEKQWDFLIRTFI